MVNHILTDIFAHAKRGGSRGLMGDFLKNSIKHLIKQIYAEKNKTTMFFLLCFFLQACQQSICNPSILELTSVD